MAELSTFTKFVIRRYSFVIESQRGNTIQIFPKQEGMTPQTEMFNEQPHTNIEQTSTKRGNTLKTVETPQKFSQKCKILVRYLIVVATQNLIRTEELDKGQDS